MCAAAAAHYLPTLIALIYYDSYYVFKLTHFNIKQSNQRTGYQFDLYSIRKTNQVCNNIINSLTFCFVKKMNQTS